MIASPVDLAGVLLGAAAAALERRGDLRVLTAAAVRTHVAHRARRR